MTSSPPFRLVTLLDMLEINAKLFVDVLGRTATLHQVLMVQINSGSKTAFGLRAADFDTFRENLNALATLLSEMDLPVSALSAADLLAFLDRHRATSPPEHLQVPAHEVHGMASLARDIGANVRRELSARILLTLPFSVTKYYAPKEPPFGADIATAFASAAFEIDEAGKCFALNRHTAAVFHLMRVLEIGITAARKSLQIPDPIKPAERNWAVILRKFKEEFDRRNTQKPPQWAKPENADFFAEIHASLDAVKNVWRNATMHVEKTYTEEEAEHVMSAVRGFMKKLASHIDENGLPHA